MYHVHCNIAALIFSIATVIVSHMLHACMICCIVIEMCIIITVAYFWQNRYERISYMYYYQGSYLKWIWQNSIWLDSLRDIGKHKALLLTSMVLWNALVQKPFFSCIFMQVIILWNKGISCAFLLSRLMWVTELFPSMQ